MTARAVALSLALVAGGLGPAATAQQPSVEARVEYLAGSNAYLNAGREQGIFEGDTLLAYRSRDTTLLGVLVVLGSSSTRSVVTIAGRSFPLTRGAQLRVVVRLGPRITEAAPVPPLRIAERATGGEARGRRAAELHGRLSLDVSVLQSTVSLGGTSSNDIDRTFATPSLGLNLTASRLPGGLIANAALRGSYRYSSTGVVQPARYVRLYQLNLERSWEALHLRAGRFYNPYESFSGYWDGLLVRLGSRDGFGVGAVSGFEPNLANQQFSSDLPKYTVFLDFRRRGRTAAYSTDLSWHQTLPDSGHLRRMFVGWSHSLAVGNFRLGNRVRVDRGFGGAAWEVSEARVDGSLALRRGFFLRAQAARQRPQSWLFGPPDSLPARRDEAGVGLGYWGPRGGAGADLTVNRTEAGLMGHTYSGAFAAHPSILGGLGVTGSGSYWQATGVAALHWSAGLDRDFGAIRPRLTYQFYRTVNGAGALTTRVVELSADAPLARQVHYTVRARAQYGDQLSGRSVYTGLWMSF